MNSIELFRGFDAWYARQVGPASAQVRALFGTDTLPTAFTSEASPDVVLAEVARLNPGVRVYLRAVAQ